MRLIDANSVIKDILWVRDNDLHVGYPRPYEQGVIRKALRCVEEATTIEAMPIMYGKWEIFADGGYADAAMRCSVCSLQFENWSSLFNYCPCCGAKMDGE